MDGDREPYALELLSTVLDGGDSTRFTRNVVRGSRVANQAGAGYSLTQRRPAQFTLDGTPADGRTTAELEQALARRAGDARAAARDLRVSFSSLRSRLRGSQLAWF